MIPSLSGTLCCKRSRHRIPDPGDGFLPCNNDRGTAEKKQHFVPTHNPRALICYCVRNLYVTIRATKLAKISSAVRDFRIVGPVELRAADEAG